MSPIVRGLIRSHRPFLSLCFVLLAVAGFTGCSKSSTPNAQLPAPSSQLPPVLKFHWLGKQRLAAEANATNFMAIWNLPESTKLEAQTLDKLATAPWRFWQTNVAVSNAPTGLLRPLLDDLLQHEVYVEASGATNHPAELVLAIHLPADRAALWQTNLPQILTSLFATNLTSVAPSSIFHLPSADVTLSRSNDWTLLSFTHSEGRSAVSPSANSQLPSPSSSLLTAFHTRLANTPNPYPVRATNHWIEADFDLASMGAVLRSDAALANAPHLALNIVGQSGAVRVSGELLFPGLAPINLEPWNIPTNLIHDPLVGFMALRGFRPALEALSLWNESKSGFAPNQVSFWIQDGHPALRFFAFPASQADSQMALFSQYLLKEINPLMAVFPNTTNVPLGAFEPVVGSQRLRWRGMPYVMPNLEVVGSASNQFITGGLFQNRLTNQSAPESLLGQFRSESNLILYDWEMTKTSALNLIQMSQATRMIFGRNRLSLTNNAALPWIVAVAPRLEVAATSVQLLSADRIGFSRSATIGLTGTEIHLLAEWLESPEFPRGFFSLNSPRPPASLGTNSPQATVP